MRVGRGRVEGVARAGGEEEVRSIGFCHEQNCMVYVVLSQPHQVEMWLAGPEKMTESRWPGVHLSGQD
jgi:hypothetical protein